MSSLKGKAALVTGSTRGIGYAVASALAGAECDVMMHGLGDPQLIEAQRARLSEATGVRVGFHGGDLTQPEQIRDLIESTTEAFGGVDILVNNAGIQHTAAVEAFPEQQWNLILQVNLSAAFHTTRRVLPLMKQRGWGRIINTASVHGLVGSVNKCGYVAAKHGLVGLTKVVALETAGSGVTCNAICPGWTRTELIEPQIAARAEQLGGDLEAGARDLLSEKQPSQQFVEVDQIGRLVLFLCSDAARQMTGLALPIDGGWTAQ